MEYSFLIIFLSLSLSLSLIIRLLEELPDALVILTLHHAP